MRVRVRVRVRVCVCLFFLVGAFVASHIVEIDAEDEETNLRCHNIRLMHNHVFTFSLHAFG